MFRISIIIILGLLFIYFTNTVIKKSKNGIVVQPGESLNVPINPSKKIPDDLELDYKNHFNYDSDINYEEEEDRVDIEFDPSLPLNLPIQSNKPQQIITPESLEKHQGKTIKEVFDSLIPNYRTNEEIVSNISGNNLEFKEEKGFDNTYEDSSYQPMY